jgi:hypothetical protein
MDPDTYDEMFGSYKEFITEMDERTKKAKETFDKIEKDLEKVGLEGYDADKFGNISAEAAKGYSK